MEAGNAGPLVGVQVENGVEVSAGGDEGRLASVLTT